MKLKNYHEIVGTLEEYMQENDKTRLVFQIQKTIELPREVIPKEELEDCINRKIAIFNNDGDYRLRKSPKPIEKFKSENCPKCSKQEQCSKDGLEITNCLMSKINELRRK